MLSTSARAASWREARTCCGDKRGAGISTAVVTRVRPEKAAGATPGWGLGRVRLTLAGGGRRRQVEGGAAGARVSVEHERAL
eukprot:scaffold98998_cov33-Phaeocystis_antarctica.AAC.1